MILGHTLQVHVFTWRVIWRNTLLVNLRVCREPVEEGEKLRVHLHNLGCGVDSWVLDHNVQLVLQCWNDANVLPVIMNRLNNIRMDVNWFTVVLVIQQKVVINVEIVKL